MSYVQCFGFIEHLLGHLMTKINTITLNSSPGLYTYTGTCRLAQITQHDRKDGSC